jgi:SET family sugar efflux transporter-like MFS transporter
VSALRLLWRGPELRVVLFCSTLLGLAMSFVAPFLSMFGTLEVKMSLGLFGLFMTANACVNIVISTVISRRSDAQYSRRSVLLWAAGAGAIGYAGYAWAREPWQLFLIGGFVLGVASLGFSQLFAHARELLARSAVPALEVPLFMNAFRMAFALAWTVGPAVAAFTLQALSFKGLFIAAGLLYLALFVLVWCFVRDIPPHPKSAAALGSGSMTSLLGRADVFAWFLSFVLILAAHTMSMNNMSLLVLNVLGGTESHVGVIFSLAPLFELPFMLYFGLLATRVESERLIRVAMAIAIVYYLGLACVRTPQQIYPLQFLAAAIVAVTSGVAITFFQNKLPDQLGSATNIYANASRVGSTSGYLLFGSVAARFGHRGASVACAVLAGSALVLSAFGARRPIRV